MTPEERAAAIRKAIEALTDEQICGTAYYPEIDAVIAAAIRAAEEAAEARGAAAEQNVLAEQLVEAVRFAAELIAAAIRSR